MASVTDVGSDAVADVLLHAGTKGMKWGVRNDKKADKKAAKADAKWEKKALSRGTVIKVYNQAATAANKDLPGINKKYAGKDLIGDPKARLAYDTEVVKNFNGHVQTAAKDQGVNPSGTKKLTMSINPLSGEVYASVGEIQHAADDKSVKLLLERDEDGYVVKISFPKDSETALTHAITGDVVGDILEHAGVKGMKWGVRRSQKQLDSSAGRKTKTKKEDVKSLSDADLRAKLNRLQMEKQYKDLTKAPPGKAAAGKKFASEVLREVAKQTVVSVGKSHSMKAAGKYMAKP